MEGIIKGGVEDTTFEAKAKDSKKIRGQGPTFGRQTLLRPRTDKDRGHNFSKLWLVNFPILNSKMLKILHLVVMTFQK